MPAHFKQKYAFTQIEKWQNFIYKNAHMPLDKLLFSIDDVKEGIDRTVLANQLFGKKIAATKLPSWHASKEIIYPPKLNLEQCSSELTAKYKSQIIHGHSFLDLCAGLGVDTFFIAQSFEKSIHCELNEELHYIAKHNLTTLSKRINFLHGDGIELIKTTDQRFDLIYLDPSRRNRQNKKVVKLEDYTPNPIKHLKLLLQKGNCLLIKTSPLLDIHLAIKTISNIKTIHVIAINNDCKELLLEIHPQKNEKPVTIKCLDLGKHFSFTFNFEIEQKSCNYSKPLNYLYEPNSSILKAGGFNSIANHFGIYKLHLHSHLYTSNTYISTFPGRCFEILNCCAYNKKDILSIISNKKANVTKRNFPHSVDEIQKKLGIKDGGDYYLFATTLLDNKKKILVCKKY